MIIHYILEENIFEIVVYKFLVQTNTDMLKNALKLMVNKY